jgi:DNA-binding NarL/FixJ family response regulator
MPITLYAATSTWPKRRSDAEGGGGPGRIRVLLADDHKLVREGIALLLVGHPRIEVLGQAGDGQEAIEKARRLKPDVVLMDVTMPRLNGIEATRTIRQELPQVRVVGLSIHTDAETERLMRAAGAVAYLPKDGDPDDLIDIIVACVADESSS